MKKSFLGSDEITPERREHLVALHGPLQRVVFFIAGPIAVLLYGISAFRTPVWQNIVMFCAMCATFAAWGVGVALTRRGRLEASVHLFMSSVLLFQGIEISMVAGNEATEIIACFAVVAYGALFNKRCLYVSAIALALLIAASELIKCLHLFPVYAVPPTDRLIQQISFTFLLTWLVIHILGRGQAINEIIYKEMQKKSLAQAGILGAVKKLQPVIDRVSAQLKQIANGFVAQSSQHAATTSEVSTTMDLIMNSAEQSSAAAGKAKAIADTTRERSVRSRDRLLSVQRGFGDVAKTMDASLASIDELTRQAENIEEVLGYNREIGEHIKVLAVNAAIEAATAGEYGRGFRVVAEELREMIVKTDANLIRSSQLLEAISKQAKNNAAATQKSSETLSQYYEELRATGELIDSITEGFVTTSKQIGSIAESVQREVSGIEQVRIAVAQIDATAGQLESAARVLVSGVEEISASHGELRAVLEAGKSGTNAAD